MGLVYANNHEKENLLFGTRKFSEINWSPNNMRKRKEANKILNYAINYIFEQTSEKRKIICNVSY